MMVMIGMDTANLFSTAPTTGTASDARFWELSRAYSAKLEYCFIRPPLPYFRRRHDNKQIVYQVYSKGLLCEPQSNCTQHD